MSIAVVKKLPSFGNIPFKPPIGIFAGLNVGKVCMGLPEAGFLLGFWIDLAMESFTLGMNAKLEDI